MTEELSVVGKTRVLEYQRARRRHDAIRRLVSPRADVIEETQQALDDAEEKLLALGLDPDEAMHMRIALRDVGGDR